MKDPMRPILLATFIMITILLFMNFAVGKEKTKSEWLNENPCMIKVIITEKEICKDSMCLIKQTITEKEEVLKCKDGYDGPNYWELFAQFYYRETTTPEYCRYYTRPEHALRSFGKMCLKINGEWEVE
jgi:hypothetical protein